MVEIDLKAIRTLFINRQIDAERRSHIQSVLASLGFKDVERVVAVSDEIGYIGLVKSQIKALERAKTPFLLLEDDVKATQDFMETIQVPKSAVAVYLGTSGWALQGSRTTHFLRYRKSQYPDLFRIKNMLSTHAILFLDESFKEKCILELKKNLEGAKEPCDIIFARLQKDNEIYCFNAPLFVQYEVGFSMSDAPKWTQLKLSAYPRSFQLRRHGIPLNFAAVKAWVVGKINRE